MLRRFIFIIVLFICAGPVSAAQPWHCKPLVDAKNHFVDAEHKWINLSHDQWQFARGLFVSAAETPLAIPPGESAAVVRGPENGGAVLIWIDGDQTCNGILITESVYQFIMDVGEGKIIHAETEGRTL